MIVPMKAVQGQRLLAAAMDLNSRSTARLSR